MALGTFDGIHEGHRAVLDLCDGYELTVLTFRIPPKSIIFGANELLMLPDNRKKKLLDYGAKKVEFLDFDSVKDISAEEFLCYIKNNYSPDLISCGFNYRFGKNAQGNGETIKVFCENNGIEFKMASPVYEDGAIISSTSLRNLIKSGEIESANCQIFGGFEFSSEVLNGDKRGRQIGFPTINQKIPQMLVCPKYGVYASKVKIDGMEYDSITNLGIRPTFETEEAFCETHILGFSEDIYGKEVTLSLKKYIREERKFISINELKTAIKNDIANINNIGG